MKVALLCGAVVIAGMTVGAQNPPPPKPVGPPPDNSIVSRDPILVIANLIVPDEVLEDAVGPGNESFTDLMRLIGPRFTPPAKESDLESSVQDQDSVLEDIAGDEKLVISSASPAGGPAPSRGGIWAIFRSPFAVLSAAQAPPGTLKFLFTSRGVSSGEAFDVQVVNDTGKPVELRPGALVVRPLKSGAGDRLTREFAAAGSRAVKLKMLGYCLQFRKQPPKAGMIFTLAPQETQREFTPAHQVFAAAFTLKQRGLIKPTGNPTAYYHSIRQWAWWTREQKLTPEAFTREMLEYTKKNLANAKQPWTKEAEAYVRATVPKRWTDITNVLRLADMMAERARRLRGALASGSPLARFAPRGSRASGFGLRTSGPRRRCFVPSLRNTSLSNRSQSGPRVTPSRRGHREANAGGPFSRPSGRSASARERTRASYGETSP
jgi:hypothetical protein